MSDTSPLLDRFLDRLSGVKKSGTGFVARCPAHDDRHQSLSIGLGDDGRVLVKCHAGAGCSVETIVDRMGLQLRDLFDQPLYAGQRLIDRTYDYLGEDGNLLFQAVRYLPKGFSQRAPSPQGWVWSLKGVRIVPYRLPDLVAADPSRTVLIVEGEKDVDELWKLGFVATCNPMGAGKWRPEFNAYLAGRHIVVIPDNDQAGIDHATAVAASLAPVARTFRLLEPLPGLAAGGDTSDWLDLGGDREKLIELIGNVPQWIPGQTSAAQPPGCDKKSSGSEASHNRLACPERTPFPVDCLPGALRTLCEEASTSFGFPTDYVAVPGLTAMGALSGGSVQLEISRGWIDRGAIWGICIGDPGSAKSPAQDLVLAPVRDLRRSLYDYYKVLADNYDDLPKKERSSTPPELEVLMTTDTTIEGVARHHANTAGLLVAPDELTSWLAGFNRYRGQGASERGQWLSIWALTQIVVTRAGKGATVIPRPTVGVVGGIQPDRLRALLQDANGAQLNDGLVDRILPCWPEAAVPEWSEEELSPEAVRDWDDLLRAVRTGTSIPLVSGHAGDQQVQRVCLSSEAKGLWKQWYNSNRKSTLSANGFARGWSAKAPRHLARLALILHIGNTPNECIRPVAHETLEAAVELVEWFRSQHGLMLAGLGVGASSRAAGVDARVHRMLGREDRWFSRSEIYLKLRNVPAPELGPVLDEMVEMGRIEHQRVITESKPRDEFRLHSFILSQNLFSETNEKMRKYETMQAPVSDSGARCKTCGGPLEPHRTEECRACTGRAIATMQRLNPEAWTTV